MTSADVCRKRGWNEGDVLVHSSKSLKIRITAIGKVMVLGREVFEGDIEGTEKAWSIAEDHWSLDVSPAKSCSDLPPGIQVILQKRLEYLYAFSDRKDRLEQLSFIGTWIAIEIERLMEEERKATEAAKEDPER